MEALPGGQRWSAGSAMKEAAAPNARRQLVRATATIGGLTLISRILGFMRDQLMAHFVGAGMAMDCFLIAFRLPNLFRALFAEGAFATAFVPIFSRTLVANGGDPRAGIRFSEDALSILLPILLLLTGAMQYFASDVVRLMTGGFVHSDPQKFHLAVAFTQITFPYLLFISLVSLQGGILNSLNRFSAAAAAPVLLNLTLIAGLLIFHSDSKIATARAQSIAVTISGITQFLWLVWACHRAGIALHLRWPRLTPKVRELLTVIWPATIGAGATQFNMFISTLLAARFLSEGAISWLFYADRLNQLPLGLVGIGIGTALLPAVSRALASGDTKSAIQTQNRAIELALILTLPATAALIVIAEPLIRALLEHGAFTREASHQTGRALAFYALGLPAYVLIKVLVPGFYARSDTKTPVRIAFLSMLVNLVGNLITVLATDLAHVGIALSTAISAWVNLGLLYRALHRRDHFTADDRLKKNARKLGLSSLVMAILVWATAGAVTSWLTGPLVYRIVALIIIFSVAGASYFGSAFALRALSWQEMRAQLWQRKRPS